MSVWSEVFFTSDNFEVEPLEELDLERRHIVWERLDAQAVDVKGTHRFAVQKLVA